ncbi:hypothetical protein V8E36_009698 [Tilletia maclaganii]
MPFFKRRSSSPHSPLEAHRMPFAPHGGDDDDTAAVDSLTDSLGSLLAIHNPPSSLFGLTASSTPRTRPNSFSSVSSDGSGPGSGSMPLIGILTNVREEEDSNSGRDDVPCEAAPATLAPSMLNFRLANHPPHPHHRRASDTLFTDRTLPPRRPRALNFSTASISTPSSAGTSPSPTTLTFGSRRRQGSLSLAVDELDFKRQKRCSMPAYPWSLGLSERERALRERASFSSSASGATGIPECAPTSPVMPLSPLEHLRQIVVRSFPKLLSFSRPSRGPQIPLRLWTVPITVQCLTPLSTLSQCTNDSCTAPPHLRHRSCF